MRIKQSSSNMKEPSAGSGNFRFPFAVVTGLFFIWGFITSLNDILLPYLKHEFVLSYLQATLIQFAFFGAYFIGSSAYFFSSIKYGDLIERIGYKNCILAGLLISFIACLLFYPASVYRVYGIFLTALFCLGLGFTLLQIAANPYIIILGPEKEASSRLNLAQGINSLGTTVAPLIGGHFIFKLAGGNTNLSEQAIQNMYLLFGLIFISMAVIIRLVPLPAFKSNGPALTGAGALNYPHLVMGIVAIFTYVGGEVSIGSLLISFLRLPEIAGLTEAEGSKYVSLYWGGLMVGRFTGAIFLNNNISPAYKYALAMIIVLLVFSSISWLTRFNTALYAAPFLLLNLLAFFIGRMLPARTMGIFSIVLVLLILTAIFGKGHLAMWALISAGLFNSILWSNIFSLSLSGLGKYTSQGSSLLIMAILGAALIPVIQGALADAIGLQYSFFITLCCYLYLLYYGFAGYKKGVKF